MQTLEKDVIEGNKLIAEFMGYKINEEKGRVIAVGKKLQFLIRTENANDNAYGWVTAQYHSSWDCLMPAWKKFYSEIILDWYKDNYTKEAATDLECMEYSLTCAESPAMAFKYFVNLIKFYNKNK